MRTGTLLALLALCACSPGSGRDPWVAEVDGQIILFSDLHRLVEARAEQAPEAPREDLVHEELNRLVSQQAMLNRARELHVRVSASEAEQRLRDLHGNDFNANDREFVEEIRRQMTLDRAALVELAGHIQIPESTLVLYFEENRYRHDTPEQAQIRQIVVEDEDRARNLLAELRGGADFAALARQHSLAPEAEEGGLLAPFARGEMPEVFDRVFALQAGELSEVLVSPYGVHIFRLEARIPPHEAVLAEVRSKVLAELEQKRLAELRREWERELWRDANVRVNERLLETLR